MNIHGDICERTVNISTRGSRVLICWGLGEEDAGGALLKKGLLLPPLGKALCERYGYRESKASLREGGGPRPGFPEANL